MTERFLPDKAIDLIDEFSSRVRMYKSQAAKTAKELMASCEKLRQNHALALEDGRQDDAQDYLERQEDPRTPARAPAHWLGPRQPARW